jgi:hypothetical protein
MDLTRSDEVSRLATEVRSKHGRIDIAFNNAGIAINAPSEECSDEDWHKVININLHAVFYCCREFGKVMLEQGKGSIINTASMSGIISNTPQPQSAYNVSKAGVIMLTKSLAGEMGKAWCPRQQRFSRLHRHGDDKVGNGQSGMACGLAKIHADGPPRRTARGRDRRGVSCIRCEQLFHRKQSRRRRRIYLLVIWEG